MKGERKKKTKRKRRIFIDATLTQSCSAACIHKCTRRARVCSITHKHNSPMRGMAICIKWACSWSCAALSSACSPSRSFPRTSWGTLHPHPFRSANRVKRKVASRSCATGSNGLRNAKAFGLPPSSSCTTDRASWATGVPCISAILYQNLERRRDRRERKKFLNKSITFSSFPR